MSVHCPGQRQIALGAKLASGHEDDVLRFWQRFGGGFIEQVAVERFNATGLEPGFYQGIAKAGNADDAAAGQRGLGEAGERRSHLAGDAEDHDVAIDLLQVVDQRLTRAAQQLVKGCDIENRFRQSVAREQHIFFLISHCSRTSLTTNSRSRPSTRPYSVTPSNVKSTTAITMAGVSSEDCT